MRHLLVHVFCCGFCFFDTLIGFLALFENNGEPRPQVFFGFFQQAQAAVFLNILDGRASALQTLDALHPVDGFLIEYPPVPAVTLAGQQTFIRIEAQRVLRDIEQLRHLPDRIIHDVPPKILLDFVLHELVRIILAHKNAIRKYRNGGRNMEYLTLNNGEKMPLVGFGTFMLGGEACKNAVASAIQNGYRMIDTAEAYGNEKDVGEGIQASGIDRGELFLATKVNFKSYENAEQSVMQSLKNLQTDYLDLLLLHWPFANYYAAWRVLEKLYAEGKVRAIGVSNFEPDQLLDLIAYNKVVPAVNQIETNLYCQRSTERGWMDKKNVAHMAYAPLGQGNRNEMFGEPAVLACAEKYRKTPAQILLRFLTQKGIAVIPRSTKPEHIRENFALFDFTLTLEDMAQLSALDRKEPLIGKPETPELVEFSLTW